VRDEFARDILSLKCPLIIIFLIIIFLIIIFLIIIFLIIIFLIIIFLIIMSFTKYLQASINDFNLFSINDIVLLAKHFNIPFLNKNQAINVLAFHLLKNHFSKTGNMKNEHDDLPVEPVLPLITNLLISKIGRDPTKYILSKFLKNKDDLLVALGNRNTEWINYFDSLGGMIYNDIKYLNAIIDSDNTENMKFYNGTNWNIGLKRACLGGNLEMVKLMIQKGGESYPFDWNSGLIGACECGHLEIVELMIQKGGESYPFDWNSGLKGACEGGHLKIVELMIQKGGESYPFDWNSGLKGACEGGHMEIVELMIQKGATWWDIGLKGACWGGNIEIVKLMIKKGAKNWDLGLIGACEGGHMKIVELMIQNGATYWNGGLTSACLGGHMKIVVLMIQKGADKWDWGLQRACEGGHMKIVKFLICFGAQFRDIEAIFKILSDNGHFEILDYIKQNQKIL